MDTLHIHTALPDDGVPDWVHLLPAGRFSGDDRRGPYEVADPDALITHSMRVGKLPIDENHATEIAAANGGGAPAQGWIVEMQSRADGIWGRVDWTRAGRAKLADRAYRGLSPAFRAPDGRVTEIVHASLTNRPNLTSLTHLHTREPRMDLADIRRRLRLADTASQADVEAALDRAGDALTLHTRAAEIAGIAGTSSADAIVTGLRAKTEGLETHAQSRIATLEGEIKALKGAGARAAAEQRLRDAAAEGHVISDTMRDRLIQLHVSDPDAANDIISGLPRLAPGVQLHVRRAPDAAIDPMIEEQARIWGQDPKALRAAMGGNV